MSASLLNADLTLLHVFWGIAFLFMGVAIILCALIVFRRIFRNHIFSKRRRQKSDFQNYVSRILNHGVSDDPLSESPVCKVEEMTDVFLHYFRTLKGKKLERLQRLISSSDIESRINQSTNQGVRGVRMRALRTLSYLNSQSSLQVIFDRLSSRDKYVRLTAMRCLVRRKAGFFLNSIVESYIEAFPNDPKILASILAKFGHKMVDELESQVRFSDNETIRTACLEALILIRPEHSSLDFDALMKVQSETVRSATLALAAVTTYPKNIDPVKLGLEDESTAVKIRAAKTVCYIKRSDLTTELYALSNDSSLWVRYWALKAIWVSGRSGEKFVDALAQSNPTAANLAVEMRSGYV